MRILTAQPVPLLASPGSSRSAKPDRLRTGDRLWPVYSDSERSRYGHHLDGKVGDGVEIGGAARQCEDAAHDSDAPMLFIWTSVFSWTTVGGPRTGRRWRRRTPCRAPWQPPTFFRHLASSTIGAKAAEVSQHPTAALRCVPATPRVQWRKNDENGKSKDLLERF